MTRTIAAIAAALILSGCANSAGDYANALSSKSDAMKAAVQAAEPAMNHCANERQPSEIPRNEFLKYAACVSKVVQAKVVPVSPYPDLLERLMAHKVENAALYSQGKIDYEQVEARGKLNLLAFRDEMMKRDMQTVERLAAQDAAENDDMANALASFKQSPTVRTTCHSMGMVTNCTSR